MACATACVLAGTGAGEQARETVAFTLSSMPVRGAGATVYVLDRRDLAAAELGAGLPADRRRAAAEMRRRLASPSGRGLRAELAHAMAGAALAGALGIARLPAVVIDGRYVVYGVRDVGRARRLVAGWRAARER